MVDAKKAPSAKQEVTCTSTRGHVWYADTATVSPKHPLYPLRNRRNVNINMLTIEAATDLHIRRFALIVARL